MMTLCGSEAMNWSDICWEQGGYFWVFGMGAKVGISIWLKMTSDRTATSHLYSSSGWWFGCHEFYFPIFILGCCHHPNWRTHIFQDGVALSTSHQIICCIRHFWPCSVDFPSDVLDLWQILVGEATRKKRVTGSTFRMPLCADLCWFPWKKDVFKVMPHIVSVQLLYHSNFTIWLVVWLPFFIFPCIGTNHPNWLIFFRGVQTTNQLWFMVDISWIIMIYLESMGGQQFSHDWGGHSSGTW